MNKIFTLKFFNSLTKILLVAVIICVSAFKQPEIANSIGDIQTKTIKCYPNPAISFVNFEFPDDYVSKNNIFQVYSFTGKKMFETNVNTAKTTLTFTNDFYRGIYIYQIQDKTGRILETGKFQVDR
jgi:Secretion system C-terminal sorting domain